jgi:predicted nucleic acid-binding Zn ribbon protein
MQESGPERCERCGGELRRVLFAAGIIFKGSGFYKTDSRSGGTGAPTSATPPAKAATASDVKSSASDKSSAGDSGGDGSKPSAAPAKDAGKKESS